MFETELHRWLQTFNAPAIEYFMRAVSVFGEEEFYALLMLGVIFGVDRRKGFLLTQVLLWASLTTALLKHAFALPRPVDVDTLVKDITGERNCPSPFVARGASGFFDLLPPDVVAYFRAQPHISYGFPSGHCSSSVATCGSAAILFRRSWLIWATTAMIILMPISRMYLGRHFLADVLGGLVLGLLFILAAIIIERKARPEPATRTADAPFHRFQISFFPPDVSLRFQLWPAKPQCSLGSTSGRLSPHACSRLRCPRVFPIASFPFSWRHSSSSGPPLDWHFWPQHCTRHIPHYSRPSSGSLHHVSRSGWRQRQEVIMEP